MTHINFHDVSGASAIDCAGQLGRLFGARMREYVEEERSGADWSARCALAEKLLATTTRYFPGYVAELDAYCSAARIPLIDVWAMMVSEEIDGAAERCTTVVTNGGSLIAHNEDWDEESVEDICVLRRTSAGVTSLELYYYATPLGGTALTISSRGHIQAINSLDHGDWQSGVPKTIVARRMADAGDLPAELGEILSVPRASGFAHTLVERNGRVTLVECAASCHSIASPETPFVHTNHALLKEVRQFEAKNLGKSTFARREAACGLVRPSMSRSELTALTNDRSRGPANSILNRNTIARAVVDLDNRIASIWLGREGRSGWIDYDIGFLFQDASA